MGKKYCKNCGKEVILDKLDECLYCSAKLEAVDFEQLSIKQQQKIVNQKRKKGKKENILIIGFIAMILVGVIGCYIIDSSAPHVDSDKKKREEMLQQERMEECQNRSDTYYKCKWNIIEDRCTCKAR